MRKGIAHLALKASQSRPSASRNIQWLELCKDSSKATLSRVACWRRLRLAGALPPRRWKLFGTAVTWYDSIFKEVHRLQAKLSLVGACRGELLPVDLASVCMWLLLVFLSEEKHQESLLLFLLFLLSLLAPHATHTWGMDFTHHSAKKRHQK